MSNKFYNIYLVSWIPGSNDTLIATNVAESDIYDRIADDHKSRFEPLFKLSQNKNDSTLIDSMIIKTPSSFQYRTELIESPQT